jgi:hypothetical protein
MNTRDMKNASKRKPYKVDNIHFAPPNLSVPNMTRCERLHLLGNGCNYERYDEDCKECPHNPSGNCYEPELGEQT